METSHFAKEAWEIFSTLPQFPGLLYPPAILHGQPEVHSSESLTCFSSQSCGLDIPSKDDIELSQDQTQEQHPLNVRVKHCCFRKLFFFF